MRLPVPSLPVIALACLMVSVAVVAAFAPGTGREGAQATSAKLLLVAPDNVPVARLPLTPGEVTGLNVQRFPNLQRAQAALDDRTVGILIHAGSKSEVDWALVQARLREGRLIAGININMGELLDLLYPASQIFLGESASPWRRGEPGYQPDRLFYSMLVGGDGTPCSTGATSFFDHGLRSFVPRLREKLHCVNPRFAQAAGVGRP